MTNNRIPGNLLVGMFVAVTPGLYVLVGPLVAAVLRVVGVTVVAVAPGLYVLVCPLTAAVVCMVGGPEITPFAYF